MTKQMTVVNPLRNGYIGFHDLIIRINKVDASERESTFLLLHERQLSCEFLRIPKIITIEKSQIFTSGMTNGRVSGYSSTTVFLQTVIADACILRRKTVDNLTGTVVRTVINQYHLPVLIGLSLYG